MVTKEQMIEQMARAFRSVDEPDLSEGLQLEYRLSAALDASGLWPVYEAAEQCATEASYVSYAIEGRARHCKFGEFGRPGTSEDMWREKLRTSSEAVRAALTAMEQTNG